MLDRDWVAEVRASGRVSAADALELRRAIYNDGVVEPGEVERLFGIDEAATDRDPSWCELFAEAVTDYLVGQVEPRGYVSDANADWLIARIASDGTVKSATELELLVRVLEKAQTSPERLAAFALDQVKQAVLHGTGPLANGRQLEAGRISPAEIELIRRILYAFGGEGCVAVTQSEAEILFDINDAIAEADNDPAWSDLFVKSIASFTMAASGYAPRPREEQLRRDAWLDSPSGGVSDFLSRMASGGLRGFLKSSEREGTEAAWVARNARIEAMTQSSETINASEAEWLARRIGRDGALRPNEKALLRFIRDESPSVHPSLISLICKAA